MEGVFIMAVKLELYRIFRTVAEEKSISAAAKTLFISQSAVSQSIHQRRYPHRGGAAAVRLRPQRYQPDRDR